MDPQKRTTPAAPPSATTATKTVPNAGERFLRRSPPITSSGLVAIPRFTRA